jgi:phosphate transport system substrate-binding protein
MKVLPTVLAVAVMLAGCCAGCSKDKRQTISLVGSTSIQPFAELLGEEYEKLHPEANIDVQGGGSANGFVALDKGLADMGMCSRELTPAEGKEFGRIQIARDGLAIVVHSSNPVASLTREQIRGLFAGEIKDWSEVGWPGGGAVRLIMREEGSGTREAFMKLVMGKARVGRKAIVQESNGAVKELVKNDPGGIGYMSLGLINGELKAVAVDGVAPTEQSVLAGKYTMARPFLFVTNCQLRPEAQAFVDFVLSEPGQRLLQGEGLVRAK